MASCRLAAAVVLVLIGGALAGAQPAPGARPAEGHLEKPDDPYVAVPPGAQATSPALRWAMDSFVSVQVNVNAAGQNIVGDAANEPSIAVDPTNPRRMAIGWRQFDTIASNFRQAGWGWTDDGGQTWHFPGRIVPGIFRSDPVLDSDSQGNFFYNSLGTDGGYQCYEHKSSDGGQTWGAGVYAQGGDKQWMIVDKTGGVGNSNHYSFWTATYSICRPNHFTRSTDAGASYEACTAIPGSPYWGTLDTGPDGELFTVGTGFKVAKSLNARYAGQTPTWTSVNVSLGGGTVRSGMPPNPGGLMGQAWIAVDKSQNATRGNVYVLCSVPYAGGLLDVMFTRSTDGGQTWSTPVRVNDDPNPGSNYHWFGTMSVAPNGRIDAIWNDTRSNPGSVNSQVFHAYSEDAGVTWSANVALTPSFNPLVGWPNQNKIGDYYHMASDNAGAHLAYSATFNNEQDVYYLHIPRYNRGDMNCDGRVNFDDINPFVLALSDPAGYATALPNCARRLGDIDNNGSVDFDDINPFVALLSGP
ncbi:MAG: sialidase family protein [Planctomycetota bacterium]